MKKIILALLVFFHFSAFATAFEDLQRSEKEAIEADMKLYPNPVKNDRVTILFQTHRLSEIRINDITGKEVIKEVYDFPVKKAVIRVSDIPNGIYIVQIKTEENRLIAKKLMVSRN